MKFSINRILLSAFVVVFWASCSKDSENNITLPITIVDTLKPNIPLTELSKTDTSDDGNLLLGNPTNALSSSNTPDNYLINQNYYVESYNEVRGIPNWVSWHLQSSDVGSSGRSADFFAYENLPSNFYIVQPYDYNGSVTGFDRGHNCPSGDRTATTASNNTTFFMTNMIPQASSLNQGPWEGLENTIRNSLVGTNNEAYIIMGNYGTGGTGSMNVAYNTITNGHVTVPAQVWKIAIVLPMGNNDLARIDSSSIVIAVDMPNNNTLYTTTVEGKAAWQNYLTTINDIEANSLKNGKKINLISSVRTAVKEYLKTKKYQL